MGTKSSVLSAIKAKLPIWRTITLRAWGFYVLILALLLNLGFWQLHRAEQKRVLLTKQAQMLAQPPLTLMANTLDDLATLKYRTVQVTGQYDAAHQFLIDNQHLNGKVGYAILTPLRLAHSNKMVLINRGWLALNPQRSVLPNLPVSTAPITLQGRINSFPSVGMRLTGAEIPSNTWPAVVQVVDTEVLAKLLDTELFSFQVELDSALNDGLVRAWHSTFPMPPEKHVAYAIQWFGLALTFTVLFFWFHLRTTS